jgi:iron complex outermembrane receptor protein
MWTAFILFSCGALSVLPLSARDSKNVSPKIFAQKLIQDTLAAHPEIVALELSTTPPNKTDCLTIAASDPGEIGEKCGKEELTAMKTNTPFVEKEAENGKKIFAVTVPIHDSSGNVIGTAGIDFARVSDAEQAKITERAKQIGTELEAKLKSKAKMFESVN